MSDEIPPPTDADAPDDDGIREEPHDVAAEQGVLGGLMLSAMYGADQAAEIVEDVMGAVYPTDFYLPKHVLVAQAIGALHRDGKPIDVISVTDALTAAGELSRAGGAEYLHTLTANVPSAANAGHYAHIVAEKAVLRGLVLAGTRIVNMGYASEGEPEALVESARGELDVIEGRRRVVVTRVGETFDAMIDELEHATTYLPTPWESLDKIIGGFAKGNLYVFAARPGGGKSIALLQCATRVARRGAAAVSSLEMSTPELQQRLLAQFSGIHMGTIRSRTLTDIDWNLAKDARNRLVDAPIFIDDTPGVTIAHIRAHARAVRRKHGTLGAIAVDYLQLVRGEGRDRQETVSNVAEALKHMAKEFDVPVIAAAQLRRAGMFRGRVKPAPTMDDLRESGGIENNADVVILQHRPSDDKAEIELIVGKNRHGSQGKATLRWQGEYARLLDRAWSPTPHIDDTEQPT
jgi:replicative DNA helicase